jgi:Domain of unknown function DUF11/Secretion system C-terminal sorting domain/MAM domain, meprin/A5/mu/N-terminal domain of BNR-repeat neuraminidase
MRKIYLLKGIMVLVLLICTNLIFAQNKITSFPYTESFETGLGDWVQSTDDVFDWTINSGLTPYPDSGPENAFDGTNYIYALSVPNYNNEAFLDASFDFTTLSNPFLSFYYHMYGVDMGSLHIDIWDGAWNQDVLTISGEQQTSTSSPWKNVYLNLTEYAGNDSIVIRLRSTIGPNYRSDICVDFIEVFEGTDITYSSSTATQPITNNVIVNSTDNLMACIEINTDGVLNQLNVDSIFLNSNGSDNFSQDVENVSIYYTGSDSSFSTSNLFGSATELTNAITGSTSLVRGENYFWVTYDITSNSTINNIIDVECDSISFQEISENKIPDITVPIGNRKIKGKGLYSDFMPANIVVGQPDFYTQNTTVDEYTGYGSVCSAVSAKGILAVGSMNYGRVLIYNEVPDTNGAPADVVIGSPDFYTNNYGPTAEYMRGNYGVCFSPDGEKLIVSDTYNNRVLIWNTVPTTNAQPADVVIGQTDFTSSSSGVAADKLYTPYGVMVTTDGKLIINDYSNSRVLVFNQIPTENGASADVVIGQNDFNSRAIGTSPSQINQSAYSEVTNDGKLIISDRLNHRFLIFNKFPTENGASADVVIGQPDFYSNELGLAQDKLHWAWGVTVSPKGELAIGDWYNNRVLIYNEVPTENGSPADFVLGQPDFTSGESFNGGISEKSMYHPYGINYDLNGRLYVNGFMHRVMIFGDVPENTADVEIGIVPDKYAINVNDDITYTYTFTNNGPSQTSNVVVKCALPALFELNAYTAEMGNFLPFGGTWTIPQLNSGESVTLELTGTVLEGSNENIKTYASIVASDAFDTDLSNNAASVEILVINATPTISGFTPDTIDELERPSGLPIPLFKSFTIGDADTDLSELTLNALSSDPSIINPGMVMFNGEGKFRQLMFIPTPEVSGTVYITVQVSDGYTTAESTYMLVILSTNTNLSDILIDDVSLIGFDPATHSYSYELADGVTAIPVTTATVDHPNSVLEIFETDTLAGTTTITVRSESGSKANYYVNFYNALVALNDATLSDISVESETVEGFAPFVYEYTEQLPFGTIIVPGLSTTASNSNATVDIVKALTLPGSDTITVTAEDAVTIQKYIVNYEVDPGSNNANLLLMGHSTETGFEMIPNFDTDVINYNIEFPYGTTFLPVVNGAPEDMDNATINYTQITSFPGTAEAEVTAQDGISTKTYTVNFTLTPASDDATLLELLINGSPFFGFNPNITDYNILLENGASIPTLTAEVNHDSATLIVTDATVIPGTGTVIVTAQDGSTLAYNVNFDYEPLSSNADLTSLNVNGNLVSGFNTDVYTYNVELAAGTTEMPLVTISTYDENTKYSIVDVTVLPGSTIVTVTSEDNSVTNVYTVNFTVALNDDATLSDLQVDAVTVVGFDPAIYVYNIVLAEGTLVVPTVTYTATDVNTSDLLTDAASLPGTTTVSVTAEDGVTNLEYVINYSVTVAAGTDASLSDLQVDGETIPDFVSFVFDYTYELPYGTLIVPTVTYTPKDALATPVLTDAASVPGTSSVEVTSEDLSTVLTYNVEFTIAPASDNADLSEIQVDGESIADFDASVTAYIVELPYGTTIVPTVTATTDHSEANESITDAAQVPGTTTIEVTAENTTSIKSYTVEFTWAAPNNDAYLNSLSIDGTPVSTFNKNIFEYNVELAIGTTIVPTLTFVLSDDSATTVESDAVSLPGTSSVTVTAQDGTTELTYNVNFTVKKEVGKDATLKDITVNSISIDDFDVNDLEYTVNLPGCTNFIEVIGIANDASASVDVNYPVNYPGQVEIKVTSLDETVELTYLVNILAGTDATLSNLKVDGTTISGFDVAKLAYDVVLPSGTTTAPAVSATTNDIYANASINDASALPGKTTVKVTAEDGTTEITYEINFTVATSINEISQDLNIKLYPNPTNGIVYLSLDVNTISKGSIEVFNSTGSRVYSKNLHNKTESVNEINLSNLPKGMYFVKINTDNNSNTKKLIIK